MATANFARLNASKVFSLIPAVDEDYTDIEIREDIGMIQCDIVQHIEQAIAESEYELVNWVRFDTNLPYSRSYPSDGFATLSTPVMEVLDHEVTLNLFLTIRSGYYQGVNFDWHYNIHVDSDVSKLDSIEDWSEHIEGYLRAYNREDMPLWYARKDAFLKDVEGHLNNMVSLVEEAYARYTTPLIEVARFSNGEVVYREA